MWSSRLQKRYPFVDILQTHLKIHFLEQLLMDKTDYAITDEEGYFQIELSSLSEVVTIRFIGF